MSAPKDRVPFLLLGGFLAILAALATASPARAETASPWWQLTAGSRPSQLWAPRDEVQEINTEKEASGLFVGGLEIEGKVVACLGPNAYCSSEFAVAGSETAAQLQAALESPEAYGPGNVKVTGGKVGNKPFMVAAQGAAAGSWVAPLEMQVSKGSGSAEVTVEGGSGRLVVRAVNVGDAPVDGSVVPLEISDSLPEGLVANHAVAEVGFQVSARYPVCAVEAPRQVSCQFAGELFPFETVELEIYVSLTSSPPEAGTPGHVTISGGEGPTESVTQPIDVSSAPVPFGFESYSVRSEAPDGAAATQAGSHPFQLTTSFMLNSGWMHGSRRSGTIEQPALPRNVGSELPAGLVGNATALPKCPFNVFNLIVSLANECPAESAVGVAAVTLTEPIYVGLATPPVPVFNLPPARGEPARFGFVALGVPVILEPTVRSGADYGVSVRVANTAETAEVLGATTSFWGVPGDPRHDEARGWACTVHRFDGIDGECEPPAIHSETPFLRLPTSCLASLAFPVQLEPWNVPPGSEIVPDTYSGSPTDGCNREPFGPSLSVTPESHRAASPSGLDVSLKLPQVEAAEVNNEADLRNAAVKLPAGVSVNPSSANGLGACTNAQIGYKPGTSEPAEFTSAPAECPDQAKIGTVEVRTRLLENPLRGSVYVAKPHENPFGSLLAIYIAVDDPASGVVVKLPGLVEADPQTGRLTTTFSDNPQLPFEEFKLHFFGGNKAALKTPETCGAYETTSTMTPWSAPQGADAHPADSFSLDEGPGGGPACAHGAAEEPNSPSFEAGSEDPIAGAYSPFVLHLRREDGSQQFSKIETVLPPGMIGKLAGVSYCPESDIRAAPARSGREEQASPSCPASSEVGTVTVGSGAGPQPYYVQGHAYLTGPYEGGSLGLAIITPAVAGPYDLGTVVVRAALHVDPYTTQITVTSDPIPSILDGIPLDVRSIAVKMDRSQFTLNPTNCEAMAVGGSETSVLDQTASLSNRFQVGECAKLGFHPHLAFRLKGGTGRTGHPSLTAWLKMPEGGANIGRAQVSLPGTELLDQGNLNKVCKQAEIASASCPKKSIYGWAKAWSPLLEAPLEGPVFLGVGYGYKLPALVAELNGQIRVLLKGRVDTAKDHGIRNTFELVPDAPVSRFMLHLKGGRKYGLIENSKSLCERTRRAAARFVGQNGKVVVTHPKVQAGCKGHAKKSRRHHKRHHGHRDAHGQGHGGKGKH